MASFTTTCSSSSEDSSEDSWGPDPASSPDSSGAEEEEGEGDEGEGREEEEEEGETDDEWGEGEEGEEQEGEEEEEGEESPLPPGIFTPEPSTPERSHPRCLPMVLRRWMQMEAVPFLMHKTTRLKITDINQHLLCVLCGGYVVDASAIIECLHSFCRSCIVRYLETSKFCPVCDVQVHKTKPHLNIRPDKALQALVYKLVPSLFKDEMRRRRQYYSDHPQAAFGSLEDRGEVEELPIYTDDEQISLCLLHTERLPPYGHDDDSEKDADRRHLLCPAAVTIGHLKKFLRLKFDLSDVFQVEVLYSDESLNDAYTLMDIAYIYGWRRVEPLKLRYLVFDRTKTSIQLPMLAREQPLDNDDQSEVVTPAIAPAEEPETPSASPHPASPPALDIPVFEAEEAIVLSPSHRRKDHKRKSKGRSPKSHRRHRSPKSPKTPKEAPRYPRIRIKPPTPPEELRVAAEKAAAEEEAGKAPAEEPTALPAYIDMEELIPETLVTPPNVDMEELIPETVVSPRPAARPETPAGQKPKTPVARPPPLPLVSGGDPIKQRVARPPPLPLISDTPRPKVARPPPLPLARCLEPPPQPQPRKVGRPPKVSLKIFNNAQPKPGRPKIKYVTPASHDEPPPVKRKRGRPRKSEQMAKTPKMAAAAPVATISRPYPAQLLRDQPRLEQAMPVQERVPTPAPFVVVEEGISQEITVQENGLDPMAIQHGQFTMDTGHGAPDGVNAVSSAGRHDLHAVYPGAMTDAGAHYHVEASGEGLEEPPPSNCTLASDDTGFGSEPPALECEHPAGAGEVVDLSRVAAQPMGYEEDSQGFSVSGEPGGEAAPPVGETRVQMADSTGSPSLQEGDGEVDTLSRIPPSAEQTMERYMSGPRGAEVVEAVSTSPQANPDTDPQGSATTIARATVETQTSPLHCGPQSPSSGSPQSPEIHRVCRPQDKHKKSARLDAFLGKIHDKAIKEQQQQLSPRSAAGSPGKSPPPAAAGVQRVNGHSQLSPSLSPKGGQHSPRSGGPHGAGLPPGAVRSSSGPRLGGSEFTSPGSADSTQDPATPIRSLKLMCTGIEREPEPQQPRCGTPRPPAAATGRPPAPPFRCVGPALPSGVILTNGQTDPPLLPPPPPYPGEHYGRGGEPCPRGGEMRREPARVPSYRPRSHHRQSRGQYPRRGPGRPPLHQRGPGRPPLHQGHQQRRLPPPAYYEPPINPLANGYDAPLELTTKRSRDRVEEGYSPSRAHQHPQQNPQPVNRACLKIPSLVRP